MTHTKCELIKVREDGTKVKLVPYFYGFFSDGTPNYQITITVLKKRKRTWENIWSSNDYGFRSASNRVEYVRTKNLEWCTEEEMLEAKLALWETFKPTL